MFGKILKQLRNSNGYSMDELVRIYNQKFNGKMNKSTLSRYENGLQEPIYTVVVNLADIFEVSVDYLLGKTEQIEKATISIANLAHGIGIPASFAPELSKEALEELYNNVFNDYISRVKENPAKAEILTDEEWEQIKLLRMMNNQEQQKVYEYTNTLIAEEYKKKGPQDAESDMRAQKIIDTVKDLDSEGQNAVLAIVEQIRKRQKESR